MPTASGSAPSVPHAAPAPAPPIWFQKRMDSVIPDQDPTVSNVWGGGGGDDVEK